MKRDERQPDLHEEVRRWIALGDEISDAQRAQLRSHVDQCEACRRYSEGVSGVVRALRSTTLAADARLVRATQMRVRFHAAHLRQARERMWIMAIACLGVGLSATLTIPYLWRLFEWIGESAELPTLVWQAGFAVFFITPALVVGITLAIRGTRFTSDGER